MFDVALQKHHIEHGLLQLAVFNNCVRILFVRLEVISHIVERQSAGADCQKARLHILLRSARPHHPAQVSVNTAVVEGIRVADQKSHFRRGCERRGDFGLNRVIQSHRGAHRQASGQKAGGRFKRKTHLQTLEKSGRRACLRF